MIRQVILLLLMIPFQVAAQSNDSSRVDTVRYYYPSGKLKVEFFVKQNEEVGVYSEFNEDGSYSKKIVYYDSGTEFINDDKVDSVYYFFPTGNVQLQITKRDETTVGNSYSYYPSGKLKKLVVYDEMGNVVRKEEYEDSDH
ncbi:MAG: hypothetical protein H6582_04415 [Crocinitomicaceae bacterium]|nr:hypothetical protein [Crocinitomicaceae bacterium]